MHEVGIITQAVETAIDAARKSGAERIVRIKLRIGQLSGVAPDALSFGFDVVTKGTIAEGAHLELEVVSVRCRCSSGCGDFEPAGPIFRCPVCGAISTHMLVGSEMDLAEVEVR